MRLCGRVERGIRLESKEGAEIDLGGYSVEEGERNGSSLRKFETSITTKYF